MPPARLELALLDPQRLRELRIVAADLIDEAFGVLAGDASKWSARDDDRSTGAEST